MDTVHSGWGDPSRGRHWRRRAGAALAILLSLGLGAFGLGEFILRSNGEPISYRTWQGPRADAVNRDTQVATTSAEWNALWSGLRHEPPPSFDPAHQTGVAILLGQRPTPGYTVNVVGTELRGERLIVVIEEKRPSGAQPKAQVTTSPYTILLLNQSGAPVSIEQRIRD
jgi:hypothetical protein